MPRHEVTYDPVIKETPEWKSLYNKWRLINQQPHSEAFDRFLDFYDWSLANGYVYGAKLQRHDKSKPYSPENCLWYCSEKERATWSEQEAEWIAKWNKAVNRIRLHFGMEPIGQERCRICKLTTNYRGWLSTYADLLE